MGLFQKQQPVKKTAAEQAAETARELFDEELREELRNRGRTYFDRVINENASLFKQDLDATVAHINTELRQHVARQLDDQFVEITKTNTELRDHIAKQLDDQFVEYTKTMKDAQGLALQSLDRSAKALEEQHKQLSVALEKSVAHQDAMLTSALEEHKTRVESMKATHDQALETLTRSVQALQEQHEQMSAILEKSVAAQEKTLVNAFEQNMGQIIEHYLLTALGDQFDLKAQIPAIIKQMEANKQAIVDDMTL